MIFWFLMGMLTAVIGFNAYRLVAKINSRQKRDEREVD